MSWKSWIMFSAAVSNIKKNVLNIVKKKERKNINLIFSVFQISKHRLKEFQYMRHILLYLGHGNDFSYAIRIHNLRII